MDPIGLAGRAETTDRSRLLPPEFAKARSRSCLQKYFQPSAATSAFFLYATGPHVVCCRHDTLVIERVFSRHVARISLLAADNEGPGHRTVSYDDDQLVIVWDIVTGEEVTRFSENEGLTSTAWMRSGDLIFGNAVGALVLFELSETTGVQIPTSSRSPITAVAPFADCQTFAIGYQNGELVIASMLPEFVVLHNITCDPSPIICLAWHGNSSRQRHAMLAVQDDQDFSRVWAIPKRDLNDENSPGRVVRILKSSETNNVGPKWIGWSKNGRIVRYSDSETRAWDVRTKHVTSDCVPTLNCVKGLAVYGHDGALFTLGQNNTVQQFDLLATPPMMVANVEHPDLDELRAMAERQSLLKHTLFSLPEPSIPVGFIEPTGSTTYTSGEERPPTYSDVPLQVAHRHDDIVSPTDPVSFLGIEDIISKPHRCSEGQKCRKWRNQQRIMELYSRNLNTRSPSHEPQETLEQTESTNSHEPDCGSVRQLKPFRVSVDDSCLEVLAAALHKNRITAAPDLYDLYLVYEGHERRVGLGHKPLKLYREMTAAGETPAFVVRKSARESMTTNDSSTAEPRTETTRTEEDEVASLSPSDTGSEDASTAPSAPFSSDGPVQTDATSTSQEAVSRLGSLNMEHEKAEWLTFYNFAGSDGGSDGGSEHVEADDIASLCSLDEDIASLAETTTTTLESREAAVNFLVKKLTDDDGLLSLYQEASRRMGEAKFVRNHRRLLKRFFLDLRSEEQSPAERAAVRFLRLRSQRTRISSGIHRSVMPLEAQTREKINMKIEQVKGNLFLLDRLLGEQDATPNAPVPEPVINDDEDVISEDSEDDDDGAHDNAIQDKLPNLESVSDFLTSGKPFSSYKENLEKFSSSKSCCGRFDGEDINGCNYNPGRWQCYFTRAPRWQGQ